MCLKSSWIPSRLAQLLAGLRACSSGATFGMALSSDGNQSATENGEVCPWVADFGFSLRVAESCEEPRRRLRCDRDARPRDRRQTVRSSGIAKDVKQAGLEEEIGTECYFYYPVLAATGFAPRSMNIVLRSSSPPEGVSATDLATFVTVPVVLLTVTLFACVVPACRARLPSDAGGARHRAEIRIALG